MKRSRLFNFGANWKQFLPVVDDEKITAAESSLCKMLGVADLQAKTFLDAGCGSGLFSLAASRLGARVHSFDVDPTCVACTLELKSRYFSESSDWIVQQGSVMDKTYLDSLGEFDIVYSWGVLHHTGDMRRAIDLITEKVKRQGRLFIAIYNDQGFASRGWLYIKRLYNGLPAFLQWLLVAIVAVIFETRAWVGRLLRKRQISSAMPKKERGMSRWRDWVDWCGGYPFEVARPEEIISTLSSRGFILEKQKTTNGWGCNEFIFRRT